MGPINASVPDLALRRGSARHPRRGLSPLARADAAAALGTAGLRALDLPEHIRRVTVLADADPPGIAAANDAAWRWAGQRRDVRIAHPPIGKDFNDALLAEQSS
jgi:hypothetical protein